MQNSSQIITTDKSTSSFFTGRMPFLSPNQQCVKALKGKYHILWTCLPQAHLGVFQLCLWPLYSSWLPWGMVAMPLISLWCQYPIIKKYWCWIKNTENQLNCYLYASNCTLPEHSWPYICMSYHNNYPYDVRTNTGNKYRKMLPET